MGILGNLSPDIQQISIDEAFVDISGMGDPISVARKLQTEIKEGIGLPCSIGIATNKLVAKIATDVGKLSSKSGGPPNALTWVKSGEEASFLAPLKVDLLWGVGPKTAAKLAVHGIEKIGDLAHQSEDDLIRWFGEYGRYLRLRALGMDESHLHTNRSARSLSQETTFARDVRDDRQLEGTLRYLSEKVGRRLRKSGLAGTTVKIKLRWPDFKTITRQMTLPALVDQDDEICSAALILLHAARPKGKPVRLIGVGVSGIKPPLRQLGLWDDHSERRRKLQHAVDLLQQKFGKKVIHRGNR